MKFRIVSAFAMLLLVATGLRAAELPRLSVELRDGSRLIGRLLHYQLHVRTALTGLDVPWDRLSGVSAAGGAASLVFSFRNGDRLQGIPEEKAVEVRTLLGDVTIEWKDIAHIEVEPEGTEIVDGLIARYRLDGNADDAGIHGLNGTPHAVGPATDRFGMPNSACRFNGADSFVILGEDSLLNPTAGLSITAWAKPEVRAATRDIVTRWESRDYGSEERTYALGLSADGKLYAILSPDGGHYSSTVVSGLDPVPPGQWVFVAVTWDGAQVTLFRDGNAVGTAPLIRMVRSPHVRTGIGANIERAGDPAINIFDGSIDDVRFFNRALSREEITALSAGR